MVSDHAFGCSDDAKAISVRLFFFFLNDRAPPEIYPLPLHDALPICARRYERSRPCLGGANAPRKVPPLTLAGHFLADLLHRQFSQGFPMWFFIRSSEDRRGRKIGRAHV